MGNPKHVGQDPECDTNIYEGVAQGSASDDTGFVWFFFGPAAGAPKRPPWPAAAPLAGAALAALQAAAKADATNQANMSMDTIEAYNCPTKKCNSKSPVQRDPPGLQAQLKGVPQLSNDLVNQKIPAAPVPLVLIVMTQRWVQEAVQKFNVQFTCS
jgi:hypothetical protein